MWSMSGKNNFFFKAFGLFVNCDKMISGDFEKGLAALKAVAEAGFPTMQSKGHDCSIGGFKCRARLRIQLLDSRPADNPFKFEI